jgi:hypothetical protein
MWASAVTSEAGPLRAAAADDQGTLGGAQRHGRGGDGVFVDGGFLRRQRRLQRRRPGAAPYVDGAFEHRRAAPPRCHRRDRPGHQGGGVLRPPDARGKIDQTADDAGLVADFVQLTEAASDIGIRDLPDEAEHGRIHGIGGEQGGPGIEQAGPRHDGIGLRPRGGERGAQSHVGGALLMAGMDHLDAVGRAEQRIEQVIVVDARQGVERMDPVGGERSHRGLGRRHRLRHGAMHSVAGRGDLCRSAPGCRGLSRAVEGVPIAGHVG